MIFNEYALVLEVFLKSIDQDVKEVRELLNELDPFAASEASIAYAKIEGAIKYLKDSYENIN